MKKRIVLSERLKAIAESVPVGSAVVDVGTDHGRLPVYLMQNDIVKSVIACDVSPLPLERAISCAQYWNLQGKIDFRLGDGLKCVFPGEVDCVVIAGMGGGTIGEILGRSMWACQPGCRLVLQPMSSADDLRRFLYENGISILKELPVMEESGIYTVITAECGKTRKWQPWEEYVSWALLNAEGELKDKYISKIIVRLEHALAGARVSSKSCDSGRAAYFEAALNGLKERMEYI